MTMTEQEWRDLTSMLLDAWYATWMAARAEVEGAQTAHELFLKEPEVIAALTALGWLTRT